MRTSKPAKDERIGKQEEPQAKSVCTSLEFVGIGVTLVFFVQFVDVHVVVHDQGNFDDATPARMETALKGNRNKIFERGQHSQIDEDHHALAKSRRFILYVCHFTPPLLLCLLLAEAINSTYFESAKP
jgi:hypothetical protein